MVLHLLEKARTKDIGNIYAPAFEIMEQSALKAFFIEGDEELLYHEIY